MKIYRYIKSTIDDKGAAFFILLDPDKVDLEKLEFFIRYAETSGVDGFLIGGSLMMTGDFEIFVQKVKLYTKLPVIIFPGSIAQVSSYADAIMFISLISGRNPEHLIGKQVLAAPFIKKAKIEPISTGYILIDSGSTTTAVYISGSLPIPRNKPEIAAATALAAEYLGMKFVYLEAGSGAQLTVPNEIIKAVSKVCSIPIIVGGGLRNPKDVAEKVNSGASIIVAGNFFEDENNWSSIKDFADATHIKKGIIV
jgi:putative glycerol-1-phosphate prenyltransferase